MTVKELRTLIDNLDEYIHVPGGIERLKKTVLHLAVSGQLVPQDSSEGTGEELYQQIQTEKTKLGREGKLKPQKTLPPVTEPEMPFDIPQNWKWTRLGELTNYGTAEKAKPSDITGNTWVLELEDIEKESSRLLTKVDASTRGSLSDKNVFYKHDVLYGKLRPYLDKVIVADDSGVCSSEILPLRVPRGLIEPEYLRLCLKSPNFVNTVNELTYGVKMPRLGTDDGRKMPITLPPFGEQERIVEKVDTIFSFIDELATKYKAEQAERKKLVSVALAGLSRGDSGLAFTHLSEIIRTKADAAELRKTILHLAVSGQLVPQDPIEGTGEELYQQIQAEKTKLGREGKLKPQKTLPPIKESEVPFQIPQSWKWVRIRDAGYALGQKKPDKDFYYIDVASVDNKRAKLISDLPLTTPNNAPSRARKLVSGGTVIYSTVRPYLLNTAIIENAEKQELIASTAFAVVHPYTGIISKWILYNFLAPYFVDYVNSKSVGAAYPAINDAAFDKSIVPLPPLAEQTRIVQKTTQLLDLVTELEKHLEK
ncbi:restriction endonuclease subunit S [Candidatus Saccharibacteria bacterium]|nr:restriction endonuclease subunit S [Candidatus Saccharibacteria bacterium]NCU40771.1 restriction endonuclease subunit S [Candidatus Saccharibacteria bacterium]